MCNLAKLPLALPTLRAYLCASLNPQGCDLLMPVKAVDSRLRSDPPFRNLISVPHPNVFLKATHPCIHTVLLCLLTLLLCQGARA